MFKCIFVNDKVFFSRIWLKRVPIPDRSALVQVMAWHRTGDKAFLNQGWPVQWRISATTKGGELTNTYKIDSRPITHWGRVTHICVSKLTIIGSDNGLSPDRRLAIIWTKDGLLLAGPLGTNFSEILIEILTFQFKKMRLKVSSAKRWPFCLGLNVLNTRMMDQLMTNKTYKSWTNRKRTMSPNESLGNKGFRNLIEFGQLVINRWVSFRFELVIADLITLDTRHDPNHIISASYNQCWF